MSQGSPSGRGAKSPKLVDFGVPVPCNRRQTVVDGKSVTLHTDDDPDNHKEVFARGVEVPLGNSPRRRFGVREGEGPAMKTKRKPDLDDQMVMDFHKAGDKMVPSNPRGRAHSAKAISKMVEGDSSSGSPASKSSPAKPVGGGGVGSTDVPDWLGRDSIMSKEGEDAVVLSSETAQRTHSKKVATESILDREVVLPYKGLGEGIMHRSSARKT